MQELTGLCTSAIYTGMKRGTFPRSVQLGPRAVGWRAQDIAAYLEHGVAGVRNDNK
ncbi:AlpA family phage regulatory protein [Desulfovibrio sp.]|uniref:helix-turn-helix transcriptional regulator n=1 Tax=Desulfovibrio sp. TaxID=885 RepID=UPI003424C456